MPCFDLSVGALLAGAVLVLACSPEDTGHPLGRSGSAGSASTAGSSSSAASGGTAGAATTGSTGSVASTSSTGTTTGTAGGAGSSGNGGSGNGGSSGVGCAAAGVGGAAGAGTGGMGGGTGGGPGSLVDPQCLDGKAYAAEVVPTTRANISDLIPMFSVATRLSWSIQAFTRRYPHGALNLTVAAMADAQNGEGNCYGIAYQASDNTAQKIIAGFRTAVHECGHMMEGHDRYVVRTDLEYHCNQQLISKTPPRSIILSDEFDALGPKNGILDFQKQVYLMPTGTGNGGDQNWEPLISEFEQYINTIATSFAFYDYAPDDVIAGDATRDFAWFVERYLRILRMKYATEYDHIANDTCWRQLTLAQWGRVVRYWDETNKANVNKLWDDEAAKVDVLLQNPTLLAEIENLRVIDGCRK